MEGGACAHQIAPKHAPIQRANMGAKAAQKAIYLRSCAWMEIVQVSVDLAFSKLHSKGFLSGSECYQMTNYPGNDTRNIGNITNPVECQKQCLDDVHCTMFSYNIADHKCYLKNGTFYPKKEFSVLDNVTLSGLKNCSGDDSGNTNTGICNNYQQKSSSNFNEMLRPMHME